MTVSGFPSSDNATNVKNAVAQTFFSPVNNPSFTTLTNTSIDVVYAAVTNPSKMMVSPTFTGCKKSTESVDAVTTNFLACLIAEIAATSSKIGRASCRDMV